MSLPRYAARRDKSEPAIVEALEAFGFSVYRLDTPCDLLLGRGGITRIAECKSLGENLSNSQVDWWGQWRGNGVIVLRTVEDVERLSRVWSSLGMRLL